MATMNEVAGLISALEKDGRLDPADVVEAARDPASPLHGYFEWDDTEAARQHRLGQARQLIRRIKIETVVHSVPLSGRGSCGRAGTGATWRDGARQLRLDLIVRGWDWRGGVTPVIPSAVS